MPKEIKSPSEITEYFYNSLMNILPEDQQSKLEQYQTQVEKLSPENDGERAWLCAKWAVSSASDESGNFIADIGNDIEAIYKTLHDITFGIQFWAMFPENTPPSFNIQIGWVDNSIEISEKIAKKNGWDKVQWSELLDEMCSK